MNSDHRFIEFSYSNQTNKFEVTKNTIEGLVPSSTTVDKCKGGWIRAINRQAPIMHGNQFDIDWQTAERSGFQGKWIVKFAKSDPKIDEVWTKVIEGVGEGDFCEAKVAVPNDQFDEQVILVYTVDHNNEKDVEFRLQRMIERGIISRDAEINYKTESATRNNLEEFKYNSRQFSKLNKSSVYDRLFRGVTTRVSYTFNTIRSFFSFVPPLIDRVKTIAKRFFNGIRDFFTTQSRSKTREVKAPVVVIFNSAAERTFAQNTLANEKGVSIEYMTQPEFNQANDDALKGNNFIVIFTPSVTSSEMAFSRVTADKVIKVTNSANTVLRLCTAEALELPPSFKIFQALFPENCRNSYASKNGLILAAFQAAYP